VDLGSKKVRDEVQLTYVPAPTTTAPACGVCGALLAETTIAQHHAWHAKQDERK
jgi:hypothetical protein